MLQIIKRVTRKIVTKFYDPLVEISIGNQKLKLPLSHQLHRNIQAYPDYNFNLPRIVRYVSAIENDVRVIDIGANIGDTVAFIKNYSDVPILCIDGEAKYITILKDNIRKYNNVFVCHSLVGSENKETNLSVKVERGTAFVAEGGARTKLRTLTNILSEFPDFKNSRILKVDTDGYDTLILRGCSDFLSERHPILFFEFDPYLISKNSDNPFAFIDYLKQIGYRYLIFYVNNGDFLVSCNIDQKELIDQLIHYFSGREIAMFSDICAFSAGDEKLFNQIVDSEIKHFKAARHY